MRIAIPLTNERFCPHPGRCDAVWLAEVDLDEKQYHRPRTVQRPKQGCDSLADWLIELAVNCLITGGIGASAQQRLRECRIHTATGFQGGRPEEVVSAFLARPRGQTDENPCIQADHVQGHCRQTKKNRPAQ